MTQLARLEFLYVIVADDSKMTITLNILDYNIDFFYLSKLYSESYSESFFPIH
jgi:hypothetical protein